MTHASRLRRRDNQKKYKKTLEYMDYQRKFISIFNKELYWPRNKLCF